MNRPVPKPDPESYATYYQVYVNELAGEDLIKALTDGYHDFRKLVSAVSEERLNYSYAEGKWTIKEVLLHVMDAERIFAYRALRFARKDNNALLGFDDDEYAMNSDAAARSGQSIIDEYSALRLSTIELFKNMSNDMYQREGVASGNPMTVSALGYIIAGHEVHHLRVIRERYL